MLDLEKQKAKFKDHIATITDHGNIKVLDFKNPKSSDYRIRFLFEQDYCRLHISGDLGELIATNYNNMVYEKFGDFTNDVGYFMEKIDCHSRDIYFYDEGEAKKDILKLFEEYDCLKDIKDARESWETEDDAVENAIESILADFSDSTGISNSGFKALTEHIEDAWEYASDIGRRKTGILELYMLAFNLAQEQLNAKESKGETHE